MKFNLNINRKTDILIVDDGYSNFKPKKCKFSYLKKEIYLFYFFKTIIESILKIQISIHSIKNNYFNNLIKSFSPKVALGYEMNGKIFRIKKNFPEIVTIVYQFGHLFKSRKDEQLYGSILKNQKADYFCVFNKESVAFIKRFIKTKTFITGSIKNNSNLVKSKKPLYDFVFISQYRPLINNEKKNKFINYNNNKMKKILYKLSEY